MSDDKRPTAHPWGIGMPDWLILHHFGEIVYQAFGTYPLLVGSCLREKIIPRDIDVRLVLSVSEYERLIGPLWEHNRPNTAWAAHTLAYSILGKHLLSRTVDFQIQDARSARPYADEPRMHLGYNPQPAATETKHEG